MITKHNAKMKTFFIGKIGKAYLENMELIVWAPLVNVAAICFISPSPEQCGDIVLSALAYIEAKWDGNAKFSIHFSLFYGYLVGGPFQPSSWSVSTVREDTFLFIILFCSFVFVIFLTAWALLSLHSLPWPTPR